MLTLALIAHDAKKAELADWVVRHKAALAHSQIVCTANTGRLVQSVSQGLAITFVKSGPLGGDQQIGALIATGKIDALIFFPDPLTPMPHDVDVKALLRLALVYNLPSAYNVASADMIISALQFD